MRRSNRTRTRTQQALRLARALPALAALAAAVGSASGCSSSDNNGPPCDTTYKGKCGGKCTGDSDCATGLYCGQTGTCTADCSSGHPCSGGDTCTAIGRCVTGGQFNGGDGSVGLGTGFGDASSSACVADTRRGEGLPADIYIMNDQSLSMSCKIPSGGDRWDAMKKALTSFLQTPDALGLSVGLQYFGLVPSQQADPQGKGSCDPAVYTAAAVEIAPLPANAQPIIASLNTHGPSSYTPTPAAIEGAVTHARAWATAHPDHIVSVVLATDGEPNLCGANGNNNSAALITQVANTAAGAYNGSPRIPVYVIGIVGGSAANGGGGCNLDPAPPNRADLDKVAKAGGTGQAFIVDAVNGDTSAQFLDALNTIRGAATVPCQYVLPTTTNFDQNKVNVTFDPATGAPERLYQAASAQACDAKIGGWYYDDPVKPTKILVCPTICDQLKANSKAGVDILLGCQTQPIPIQ